MTQDCAISQNCFGSNSGLQKTLHMVVVVPMKTSVNDSKLIQYGIKENDPGNQWSRSTIIGERKIRRISDISFKIGRLFMFVADFFDQLRIEHVSHL